MSSYTVPDENQFLHLQEIEIESPISPKIRAKLHIDGKIVNIRRGQGDCWKVNNIVELDSSSDITLSTSTGHSIFTKEAEIKVSGSDALDSYHRSEYSISRSITLFKQPTKVTFKFLAPLTPTYKSARAALQKACDEMREFRTLLGSSKLHQGIDTALKIGVALSEMDPITKAVFALARTTLDLLKEQQKYDNLIPELADKFDRILPFAQTVSVDYELSQTLRAIVENLFGIVENGANFIYQYVLRTSLNRFVVSLVSAEDRNTINQLQGDLSKIKEDFDRAIATYNLQVSLQHLQMSKNAEEIAILERLNPAKEAHYDPCRACWTGTREDVINQILNWASDTLCMEKIFWLYGIPGSGKSAVATSLCHMLESQGALGASFFCRRDDPVLSKSSSVLPTLIYDLALAWAPYRELVAKALSTDLRLKPNQIDFIFNKLILGALEGLKRHPPHPFVIVLDALDEYGDNERDRKSLLSYLTAATSKVDWLKVIVTSRPDHDIEAAFTGLDPTSYQHLDLYEAKNSRMDIRLFAKEQLSLLGEQRHLGDEWPGNENLDLIVNHSRGLFISVQTIWLFIKDTWEPVWHLEQLLQGPIGGHADTQLHELYKMILHLKVGQKKESSTYFRQILGTIIAVADRRSLCDDTLASLLKMRPHVVKSVVDDLKSLLYREGEIKPVVRMRHLSLADFLLGSSCPDEFGVDIQSINAMLTIRCFEIMAKDLKFNICNLETSSILNTEVTDMEYRCGTIPDSLLYSCIQWASHLESTSPSLHGEQVEAKWRPNGDKQRNFQVEMGGHITYFGHYYFLFWLEVLSISKHMALASPMLAALLQWVQVHKQDYAMLKDMMEFVTAFAGVISQSTPHIYLSALPFSPQESAISKQYMKNYPVTLKILTGGYDKWPLVQNVFFGHSDCVTSVAISQDRKFIISASRDNTIRLWNAETGETIGAPLKGHTDWVNSIAFSHDGKRIASGSDDTTIRIWDTMTREVIGGPLEGHTGPVNSIAFSYDGKRVVSASDDTTIRVWDADCRKIIGEPLEGHTESVNSVAISHDGMHIVSGSDDMKIRIWDVEARRTVGEPLEGHTAPVNSVAFSYDGKRVISGSDDTTILLWDAKTGNNIGEPLNGHDGWVNSVLLSRDGKRIISGSADTTIRIWDADSGKKLGGPLEGHDGWVNAVALSHDGKRVISGSADTTVRVWDAESEKVVGESLEGHSDSVNSIALSHDGSYIVSGSDDTKIGIWEAETGRMVGGLLDGHTDSVNSVAFSSDSRHIVSGSSDMTIRVWDAQAGRMVGKPLEGHTESVKSVAFSYDGKYIVSGSADTTIRVWNRNTRKLIEAPLKGHTASVNSVAVSYDGKRILSGSDDASIRLWDMESRQMVGEPLEGHTGSVKSVSFSYDGKRIVSGSDDRTIRIWDAEKGSMLGEPLKGHMESINSVAFSHDGKLILSGSHDRTIRVWNVETRIIVGKPLELHSKSVMSVTFSQNGKWIFSSSYDKTIHVLDIEEDRLTMTDGWVFNSKSERLFWVPAQIRPGLVLPNAISIIGRFRKTRLSLDNFACGDLWATCKLAS